MTWFLVVTVLLHQYLSSQTHIDRKRLTPKYKIGFPLA